MAAPGGPSNARMGAAPDLAQVSQQVQELVRLVVAPARTQEQFAAADLSLTQLRTAASQLQTVLQGNPAQGVLSYPTIVDHVQDVAQVVTISQGLETSGHP